MSKITNDGLTQSCTGCYIYSCTLMAIVDVRGLRAYCWNMWSVKILLVVAVYISMVYYCWQVIELDLSQLPDGDEVLTILRAEQAPLQNWVALAVHTSCYDVYF